MREKERERERERERENIYVYVRETVSDEVEIASDTLPAICAQPIVAN